MPTRALGLLLSIGFADLLLTALLYSGGGIEERNPFMVPLLERGVLIFALAKAVTLLLAWAILVRYDRRTLRRTCVVGSAIYLTLLAAAFFAKG